MITKASLEIRTSSADIYNASKVNEIFFCHRYLHDSHSLFFFLRLIYALKYSLWSREVIYLCKQYHLDSPFSESYLTDYEQKGKG